MPKETRPPSSSLSPEQLRQVRIPFIQRASLVRGTEREDVFLVDLGVCGAFVEREQALPVGERVQLSFPLPGNVNRIQVTCRVAWWHSPSAALVTKALPAGLGLEFVEMPEADRDRLRGHLLEYLSRKSGRRFHRSRPLDDDGGAHEDGG
jgi:Tfp pilus assembly protein PilZ